MIKLSCCHISIIKTRLLNSYRRGCNCCSRNYACIALFWFSFHAIIICCIWACIKSKTRLFRQIALFVLYCTVLFDAGETWQSFGSSGMREFEKCLRFGERHLGKRENFPGVRKMGMDFFGKSIRWKRFRESVSLISGFCDLVQKNKKV